MNKEDKQTLKKGYWLDLILKLKDLKSNNAKDLKKTYNAKDLKKTLLECVDILDKVIKLEEEDEN